MNAAHSKIMSNCRPALLHVNTDPFGEENRRIKQRQESRGMRVRRLQALLEVMKQTGDDLAVLQQDFVGSPVRQRIHPASPRVQKKQ